MLYANAGSGGTKWRSLSSWSTPWYMNAEVLGAVAGGGLKGSVNIAPSSSGLATLAVALSRVCAEDRGGRRAAIGPEDGAETEALNTVGNFRPKTRSSWVEWTFPGFVKRVVCDA